MLLHRTSYSVPDRAAEYCDECVCLCVCVCVCLSAIISSQSGAAFSCPAISCLAFSASPQWGSHAALGLVRRNTRRRQRTLGTTSCSQGLLSSQSGLLQQTGRSGCVTCVEYLTSCLRIISLHIIYSDKKLACAYSIYPAGNSVGGVCGLRLPSCLDAVVLYTTRLWLHRFAVSNVSHTSYNTHGESCSCLLLTSSSSKHSLLCAHLSNSDSSSPMSGTSSIGSVGSPLSSSITHSCFHFGLKKPSFSANPSLCSLPFLPQDWLHEFPALFTDRPTLWA